MISGLVLVGALVLIWAGAAKAMRPHGTVRALRAAGLPSHALGVRALAVVEMAVGLAAAAGGRPGTAGMTASYAVLAAFVALAIRRRWSLSSCGCFGVADAPPTASHLAVNVVFTVVAAAAVVTGARPSLEGFTRHPGDAAALGLVAVVTAGLVVLTLTRLPALAAAGRSR